VRTSASEEPLPSLSTKCPRLTNPLDVFYVQPLLIFLEYLLLDTLYEVSNNFTVFFLADDRFATPQDQNRFFIKSDNSHQAGYGYPQIISCPTPVTNTTQKCQNIISNTFGFYLMFMYSVKSVTFEDEYLGGC